MLHMRKMIISNDLTRLIQSKPNVNIEEVLLHKDFSSTIKEESEILYRRILKENGKDSTWFDKIVKYALFDTTPPKIYSNFKKQISINSSNFLEHCGKQFIKFFIEDQNDESIIKFDVLQTYIDETIKTFISDKNQYNKDPMFAGNFQRFIENFLLLEAFDAEEIINYLVPFLVNNIRILAYQQLIISIINKFYDNISQNTIYKILTCALNCAYLAVKYMYNQKSFLYDLNNERIDPIIPWKKNIIKSKDKIRKYNDTEDAEIEAYLILMSIRKCITENSDIVNYFRDDDSNEGYPLIQALFYCGTRCPNKSFISSEAFKILEIVFNGSISLRIKSWKFTENAKNQLDFYNIYADEMIFDSSCLTYKMIHSFPVFWSHHYNLDKYKLSEEEKTKINISDYYNDGKTHFRERLEGETALEILQPCLLCDPPLSSQLIFSFVDIFTRLSIIRERILKTITKTKDDQNLMSEIDGIILDFYEHHFTFGEKSFDRTFSELICSRDIVPLMPMDKYFKDNEEKIRTSLNGFAIFFFQVLKEKRYPFFQVSRDIQLTCMGHRNCIINSKTFFYLYNNHSNFDLLRESLIYNRPIHSEFYCKDDEEEEDEHDLNQINSESFYYFDSKTEFKFQLESIKIGEGSTSIVYKIKDISKKKTMCKKVIKYKHDQKEKFEAIKKALKTYDILYNISHPCICKLIGINFSEMIKIVDNEEKEINTISLFHEFVDYNLSDILEMQISNTTKARIVLEIVHAMNLLHKKGIIHRNLKIDSIMINKSFETKLVKFNYATDGFSDSTDSLTKEIGEFDYMSPEIVNGEEYNNKTDVYSFGVILHTIFTGKPPKQSFEDKIKGKEIKLPRPSNSISKFCINLIERCLSYSTLKRPSFDEILQEMRENSYKLAPGVNSINLSKRDKVLNTFSK